MIIISLIKVKWNVHFQIILRILIRTIKCIILLLTINYQ